MSKSSMPYPSNVNAIGAEKRIDALVKRQVNEHQHLISNHNKEMQDLRDSLNLAIEKTKSISDKGAQDLEEFKIHTNNFICLLKDKIFASEKEISDQKKTIADLHKQILGFQDSHANISDTEKLKKELAEQIKNAATSHLSSFQDCQRECRLLCNSLKDDLFIWRSATENKLSQVNQKADINLTVSNIEKEGVVKKLNKHEKDLHVIEKKLENIYTLIERINQRGNS